MPTKKDLRLRLQADLEGTITRMNAALRGKSLRSLETVLARIGKGQQLPHWYKQLKTDGTLPNMDGKTVGSIVEMLLVAVLETSTFSDLGIPPLKINPARGVDLPDLDLGVKSPSENFCTSEPFFSAYERLLGCSHDVLVLLTDYQQAKKNPPVRLQIIKWRYLRGTQIADEGLSRIAKKHRKWLIEREEARAQRLFRFLAFVNQSDWGAKRLLKMIDALRNEKAILSQIAEAREHFQKTNSLRLRKDNVPIPDSEILAVERITQISPLHFGVLDAAENWLSEVVKDAARAPSESEWKQLRRSPLEGVIGMSLALQWRYNFGRLFGEKSSDDDAVDCE